jgi:hypothetical protein
MKGTELFSEFLMSLSQGGIINKKNALDRAIGNDTIKGNTLARLSREVVATINTMKKIFPELRTTRFHNSAEFYSLFLLVWEMRKNGFILNDRKRNLVAERMLRRLSTGVDDLRIAFEEPSRREARNGCSRTTCLPFRVTRTVPRTAAADAKSCTGCLRRCSITRTIAGRLPRSSGAFSGTRRRSGSVPSARSRSPGRPSPWTTFSLTQRVARRTCRTRLCCTYAATVDAALGNSTLRNTKAPQAHRLRGLLSSGAPWRI